MKKALSLRRNNDIVNQYSKFIVNIVRKKIAEEGCPEIFIFDNDKEFKQLGIPSVNYLEVEEMKVLDYGWLMHKNIDDCFKNRGKEFQGILRSGTNTKNWDRSINVHCPSAVKGQNLLSIRIYFDGYKENFLVINQKEKIIPSYFGAMYSHNWDNNSPEALALIHKYVDFDDDFDAFFD